MVVKLSIAVLLAGALAVASVPATTRHAAAGGFPALLDKNLGSVMNPLKIANLFWDTNWDANNSGLAMANINDATAAEVSSGYFSKLGQYGVASSMFLGGFESDPACGTSGTTVNFGDLSSFVLCERNTLGLEGNTSQSIVYMVYAPMSTQFNMNTTICLPSPPFNSGTCLTTGFPNSCNATTSGFGGFHFQTLPSLFPFDIPQVFGATFTQCANTINSATQDAAHEEVEAAIDPLPPFDWIDNTSSSRFTNGEAGDLCSSGVGSEAPPPIPPTSENPQVTGSLIDPSTGLPQQYDVAYYWSNADGACVPLPHAINLAQTGLPSAGTVTFDHAPQALPFATTVADGTAHSFSFPSPVSGVAGTRFLTAAPSFNGTVTANISETAAYTSQFFLTVSTNPAGVAALDATLTPSAWHDAGTVINLNTDALVPIGAGDRYRFSSWTGPTPGNGTGATVTMSGPMTATANYVLQHLVSFTQAGIPGGVPWMVTVNGIARGGPTSSWFDDGTSVTFAYQTPVADPNPGTRYVLTGTSATSPVVVTSGLSVAGTYQTQHLLTVSTAGLGATFTTISNGVTTLGTANDFTPLNAWLPHGTALSLSASAVATGLGGLQLFFQSFTPAPPATLDAPFSTTASYSNIPALINAGGVDNHGVANSLITKFEHAQMDIALGEHAGALSDLRAFVQEVAAQSGQRVDPVLAQTLALDALLVYQQEICAALEAGQVSASQATRDYNWYASRVTALGGTPLPPC